jgi:ferredoxin-NADP reductase/MOSC domain-containing protein YiiM
MTRLLSINVGLPREVHWLGRVVRTAIFKDPVAGSVFAGKLNLVGDGQADLSGHGGEQRAVLVYQADSYRYWSQYLARSDLSFGSFGENLTVEGLADHEVCVGDRYEIGGAIFEVSQPRVTCYKVGLRLNNPQLPALMVGHGRPGFYCRVIQEGNICAGDEVKKIAQGSMGMSIAEIDGLLYSDQHPVPKLRAALRIEALSPGWRSSFQELLAAAEKGQIVGNPGLSATGTMTPAWPGFQSLRVVAIVQQSKAVRSFELAAADSSMFPRWMAGQSVTLRFRPDGSNDTVLRTYSLCGQPGAGTFRIAVKNQGGIGSRFLNENVRIGDGLEVSAPRGSFVLRPGAAPAVLISAGIGITPLLAMLYSLAQDQEARRDVWWIHSARNGAEHSFKKECSEILNAMARARVCNFYTAPNESDVLGTDYDQRGRINLALLQKLELPTSGDFYLCGPTQFLAELRAMLTALTIDPDRVHAEIFGAQTSLSPGITSTLARAPGAPPGPEGRGPAVTFVRSGLTVKWSDQYESLLGLAEACSVPVRWSCRTGVCHNCESGLIDGAVGYSPQPLDAPAAGTVLICCSRPLSQIDLDL